MNSDYDFEIARVVDEIKKIDAKLVGLQFPEGLKDRAITIASEIEQVTGAKTIIMADPTYGACDIKGKQCSQLGLDILIHFGHTDFEKEN